MITGTVTLNNLSDAQIAQIMELESRNKNLEISIPSLRQEGGPQNVSHSGVALGWDTPEGYRAVNELLSSFMGADQSVGKVA